MEPVNIHATKGATRFAVVAGKAIAVVLGLWLLGEALVNGDIGLMLVLGLALLGGGVFLGGVDFLKYFDRRPQLSLFVDGFVDHRRPVPVVVPWDHVRGVRLRGDGATTPWALELLLTDGGRGIMVVPGRHLDTDPIELIGLIQRFAPHVMSNQSRAA
jgi:hypothetical protein